MAARTTSWPFLPAPLGETAAAPPYLPTPLPAEPVPAVGGDVDADPDGSDADNFDDANPFPEDDGSGWNADDADGDATGPAIGDGVDGDNSDGADPIVEDDGSGLSADDADADATGPDGGPLAPLGPAERAAVVAAKCRRTIASRSLALLTLIGDFVSDPKGALVAQAGPRYDAYVWLAHLDDAVLCPTGPPSAGGDAPAREEQNARILQR